MAARRCGPRRAWVGALRERSFVAGGGPAAALGGLALLAGWAPPAGAQEFAPPANALVRIEGQNEIQRETARAIDRVCPELVARRDRGVQRTGEEVQLQEVCTAMIQTARDILAGEQPNGEPGPGLGLEREELNAALQALAPEELRAPESQLTEIRSTQLTNLVDRLDALRAGIAGPRISITGLGPQPGDTILAAAGDGGFTLGGGAPYPQGQAGDAALAGQQGDDVLDAFVDRRLGVFATGTFVFGDKDPTGALGGFDFDTIGVTAGADYRLTDRLILGAAFGFSRFDAEFDDVAASPPGQELDSNSYLLSAFGTYYLDSGLFFDAIATVGYTTYDATRHILVPDETEPGAFADEFSESEFDAWQYGAAAGVGYDTFLGPVRLTPRLQVEYVRADIEGFTEEGGGGLDFVIGEQEPDSLVLRPFLQAAYPISTEYGVISPYVEAAFVHEFLDDDDEDVLVRYAADPTNLSELNIALEADDENYGTVSGGVAATLAGGWAVFAEYERFIGLSDFDINRVMAGFRKNFL